MSKTLLTKQNLKWVFTDASTMQGCGHPDDIDENCDLIDAMYKELMGVMALHRAAKKRDKMVIDQFLKEHGLKEIG